MTSTIFCQLEPGTPFKFPRDRSIYVRLNGGADLVELPSMKRRLCASITTAVQPLISDRSLICLCALMVSDGHLGRYDAAEALAANDAARQLVFEAIGL